MSASDTLKNTARSLWRKTKSALGFFILPNSFSRFGLYAACLYLLGPASGILFPRVDTTLKQNGVDPIVVRDLAPGKDVHVVKQSPAGWAQKFASAPNVFVFGYQYYQHTQQPLESSASHIPFLSTGPCTIYLGESFNHPLKQIISETTGLAPDFLRAMPITDQQFRGFVMLHETSHCGQETNPKDPLAFTLKTKLAHETDADVRGAWMAASKRVYNKPEIPRFVMYWRALADIGDDHDTALYLDAKINNRPLPSIDQMIEAGKEAQRYYGDRTVKITDLGPLGQRRVNLTLQATLYFIHQNTAPPKPHTVKKPHRHASMARAQKKAAMPG